MAFRLDEYKEALQRLQRAGYCLQPVVEYFRERVPAAVYLRHDVDRMVGRSLAMAALEQECGVCATYYFRSSPSGRLPEEAVRRIHEMGHEVGYHYETFSRANGHPEQAIEKFRADLESLRRIAPVETAAAHGSPMSRFDNRLIWDHCQPGDFGVKEAYLDIDFTQVLYLTDTGGVFGADANLRDHVSDGAISLEGTYTIDALSQMLTPTDYPLVVLSSHPERWAGTLLGYMQASATDMLTNTAKQILRLIRN